jgi:hypothetical protein
MLSPIYRDLQKSVCLRPIQAGLGLFDEETRRRFHLSHNLPAVDLITGRRKPAY